MSQSDPGAHTDAESGTEQAARLNEVGNAHLSHHLGAVAPTYAEDGTIWFDSSDGGGVIEVKAMVDSEWQTLMTIDADSAGAGIAAYIDTFINALHDHSDAAGGGAVASANSVVDQGGGNNVLTKIMDIGDWDMDVSATIIVAHGLTHTKIRSISAIIRRDDDAFYFPLTQGIEGAAVPPTTLDGVIYQIDSTNIGLSRKTNGKYDGTDYDDFGGVQGNRGWVTIWYTE
ncbi:hypothetical protein LCGC14_1169930 [marine sediment metagenome]|uniref:Uncharacterized protein n=1 Tax=marine sediment metagenome TaxID=412755 RepID=A0A0F9LQ67_9ZZZZ